VLGERLLGPSFANLRGHFEDLDFTGLHERMLVAHGAATSGWTLTNQPSVEERFKGEALGLVNARSHLPLWGWKDPRNALFLDFWSKLLPEACFLFIYRNPWEVVDSLFRRGDWDISCDPFLGARAWIEHNSRILKFHNERPERSVLANVHGIAANSNVLLALLRERFAIEIARPDRELFEKAFMVTLGRGSFEEHAIKTYVPRAFELYRQLEAAADVKGTGAADAEPVNPEDLGAPVLMQWQFLRSLESNVRLLHFRTQNTSRLPDSPT
jgi:hypothetical protein